MKKRFTNIIGLKNTATIVFAIIVFFSGIGFMLYDNSSEALLESIKHSLEDRAADNSRMLTEIFKNKITATQIIAEDTDIKSMDFNRQKDELLLHVNTLDLGKFRIINKKGLSISADGYTVNVSDREYFKKAINGIPYVSDVIKSRFDGSQLVICSAPITNPDNKIVGVLTYGIRYQVLKDLISSINVGQNGYAVLMNNKGSAIVHPDVKGENPNISIFERVKNDSSLTELANLEKEMLKGRISSGFFREGSSKRFMAYAPVKGTSWFIGLVLPENEMFSLLASLRIRFIFVTISFIVLAFYMLYLVLVYLSQRKKVEDLQKSADDNYKQIIEITELDRLKTEFFSNLSHELRTPLNVIISTLQLFEHYIKGDLTKNKQKIARHTISMKQNCFRLLRLINNLLDITRIDSGFFELRLQNSDIVSFINDLVQSVQQYAANNKLELKFNTELEEKFINFDTEKMERIMLNLLSNAIKFTPKGGNISVNISTGENDIIISVKDTGIGIPKDKQNIIFERFRKIERSLARSYEGSGIGLSLVKSLVEMHKGSISVKSDVGVGSEFIITIPSNLSKENQVIDQINYSQIKDGEYTEKVKIELSELNHE